MPEFPGVTSNTGYCAEVTAERGKTIKKFDPAGKIAPSALQPAIKRGIRFVLVAQAKARISGPA